MNGMPRASRSEQENTTTILSRGFMFFIFSEKASATWSGSFPPASVESN